MIETPAPAWYRSAIDCSTRRGRRWIGCCRSCWSAAFVAVAIYAVVPGVGQELAPLEAARGAGPAVRVVTPIERVRDRWHRS